MKKYLQKYLPQSSDLNSKYRVLRMFGSTILHPHLWRLRRQAFVAGVAVGLFWCLVPVPFQMIFATLTSLILRSNLPVSLVLCWITNPLTIPAIFYFCYRFGVFLLGETAVGYQAIAGIEGVSDLFGIVGDLWWPLYLGSFVLASVFSCVGYVLANFIWKLLIVRQWLKRSNRYR